jgi:queuine tRNA-ribosyltransferase
LAKIGNDGVSFTSHIDGSTHYLTPERSIQIQHNLGADIIFAFDECTAPSETYEYQKSSLDRTHAWAKRSLIEHEKLDKENVALYAVVQGSRYEDLRKDSARVLAEMQTPDGKKFDGYGIGGSFNKDDIHTAVLWCNEVLPDDKPKHLLGIGEPLDLILGIEAGIDTFDCVAPTRIARNGTVYVWGGRLNLFNTEFQNDPRPIDENCGCYTCKNPAPLEAGSGTGPSARTGYSRAYLAHLFRAKEMLGPTLATIHNVYFINKLVADIRQAILDDKFDEIKDKILKAYKIDL